MKHHILSTFLHARFPLLILVTVALTCSCSPGRNEVKVYHEIDITSRSAMMIAMGIALIFVAVTVPLVRRAARAPIVSV